MRYNSMTKTTKTDLSKLRAQMWEDRIVVEKYETRLHREFDPTFMEPDLA